MVYSRERMADKNAPPFGERLSQLRKAKGLSQEQLAKKLSTTRANVAYYERKATNPTLELIQRCADVLEVSIHDLISLERKNSKRGPKSKLERQFIEASKLPQSEQQLISKLLERFLDSEAS